MSYVPYIKQEHDNKAGRYEKHPFKMFWSKYRWPKYTLLVFHQLGLFLFEDNIECFSILHVCLWDCQILRGKHTLLNNFLTVLHWSHPSEIVDWRFLDINQQFVSKHNDIQLVQWWMVKQKIMKLTWSIYADLW